MSIFANKRGNKQRLTYWALRPVFRMALLRRIIRSSRVCAFFRSKLKQLPNNNEKFDARIFLQQESR